MKYFRFRVRLKLVDLEIKVHEWLHRLIVNQLEEEHITSRGIVKEQLRSALSTLHSIASYTIFDETIETYQWALDDIHDLASTTLDEIGYKCSCREGKFI
jgi:hypothetical protein